MAGERQVAARSPRGVYKPVAGRARLVAANEEGVQIDSSTDPANGPGRGREGGCHRGGRGGGWRVLITAEHDQNELVGRVQVSLSRPRMLGRINHSLLALEGSSAMA